MRHRLVQNLSLFILKKKKENSIFHLSDILINWILTNGILRLIGLVSVNWCTFPLFQKWNSESSLHPLSGTDPREQSGRRNIRRSKQNWTMRLNTHTDTKEMIRTNIWELKGTIQQNNVDVVWTPADRVTADERPQNASAQTGADRTRQFTKSNSKCLSPGNILT